MTSHETSKLTLHKVKFVNKQRKSVASHNLFLTIQSYKTRKSKLICY